MARTYAASTLCTGLKYERFEDRKSLGADYTINYVVGLTVDRRINRLPIRVLTGLNVDKLRWLKQYNTINDNRDKPLFVTRK